MVCSILVIRLVGAALGKLQLRGAMKTNSTFMSVGRQEKRGFELPR